MYLMAGALVGKTRYGESAVAVEAPEIKVDLGEGEEVVKLADPVSESSSTTTSTTPSIVDMKVWPVEEQRKFLEEQIKRLESGQDMAAVPQQAQPRSEKARDEKRDHRDRDEEGEGGDRRDRDRERHRGHSHRKDRSRSRSRERERRRSRSRSGSRDRGSKRRERDHDRDKKRQTKGEDRDHKRARV